MATSSTTALLASVYRAIKKVMNRRTDSGDTPNGSFFITGSKSVVAADYDVLGDKIELVQFPRKTYLLGASVVSDKEYDTGGTALRFDLVLDDGVESTTTTAVGSAFGNQPANDGLELVSDAAGDATQSVTVVGTTQGTDTVVVETKALDGTNAVSTTKTDWGVILAVWIDAAPAGTVTIREASGNAAVTTLTPTVLSRGVNSVSSDQQAFYGRLANIVASGSSTKQIGLKGTDADGTTIYDSQALTGTSQVQSNSQFATITEIYTGDLANTTTATVSSSEQVLVSASSAFTGLPVPINFNGAAIDGSEFGAAVDKQKLALRVAVAPTTANSGTVTFTYKCHVYHGIASELF